MKSLRSLAASVFLLALSAGAIAGPPSVLPEGGRIVEAHVLSLQFSGRSSASLIGRPCDPEVSCATVIARISADTELKDNGKTITFKQAKKRDWKLVLLVMDKFNNALLLNRIPTSDRR